jgi:hypothetical protein
MVINDPQARFTHEFQKQTHNIYQRNTKAFSNPLGSEAAAQSDDADTLFSLPRIALAPL